MISVPTNPLLTKSPNQLPVRPATSEDVDQLLVEEYMRRKALKQVGDSFLDYVQYIWPWFIIEEVHVLMAEKFEDMKKGVIDRLMIFMPPRTGKSKCSSVLFPTWWMGHAPNDQVLQISYAKDLAEGFGRESRNLLLDDTYHEVFPKTELSKDSRATASWATTAGGKYNAAGVGGGIAGKGFNVGVLDDAVSEQDQFSDAAHKAVWDWYPGGFYTRRQPNANVILLTMTRWRQDDIAGMLLAQSVIDPTADKWEVLRIPAIVDEQSAAELNRVAQDHKYFKYLLTDAHPEPKVFKPGDSFAPRRWPLKELLRTKANVTKKVWAALYQQMPYDEEGGILPRESWRKWKSEMPPACEYVIQVYDTAFEESEQSDYSARTTWGIFRNDEGKAAAVLLERYKAQVGFPELREEAKASYKEYKPDRVLIEKKASGHSLIQELKRAGVPVLAVKPKDKSKTARAAAAAIVLEQGCVYYMDKKWAREVIEDCALFPNGGCKDIVDTVVYALLYLRARYHLFLDDEEDLEEDNPVQQVKRYQRRTRYEQRE